MNPDTSNHSPRIAIYPGTFDPITQGHLDVIQRGLRIADRLIIAIADDMPKTPIFSLEERTALVQGDITGLEEAHRIEVKPFRGLLVDFAKEQKAQLIIRGLRAVSDFEYEFQLSAMNAKLNPQLQTVFLPAGERTQFIASKLVKEIARLGGDIRPFVSERVAAKLYAYYQSA